MHDADVKLIAICDPNRELAEYHLKERCKGPKSAKWQGAAVYASYQEMLESGVRVLEELPADKRTASTSTRLSRMPCMFSMLDQLHRNTALT